MEQIIKKCPRCGESHKVIIREFTNSYPAINYFAMCPVLDEPIMINIRMKL